jgi:hypothetical protein
VWNVTRLVTPCGSMPCSRDVYTLLLPLVVGSRLHRSVGFSFEAASIAVSLCSRIPSPLVILVSHYLESMTLGLIVCKCQPLDQN